MDTLLRDVAGDSYLHAAYEVQLGTGLGWDITGLDQKVLDSLISKPWSTDGRTFRDRCWVNKNDLVNSVTKNLTQGLLREDSSQKIIEAVQKQFGVSRYKAGRLVNTETTYFNAVASKQCYKDLDVEMVEIIETLDSHTCSICGGLDGKTIPMAQYEPGVTVPPFHPNCRGTTAPAIDAKYAGERAARNADGDVYYVPADMTYNDWKKNFVDGEKKTALATAMGIVSSPPITINDCTVEAENYGIPDGYGGVKRIVDATTYKTPDGTKFVFPQKYNKTHQTMTPEQAVEWWGKVPEVIRKKAQKEIVFVDYYNPADSYWKKRYKNFEHSYATGGDKITFYRYDYPHNMDYVIRTYCHEAGHYIDSTNSVNNVRFSEQAAWTNAMKSDKLVSGKDSPTTYGSNAPSEDFAESMAEYQKNQVAFAKEFPERTKLLIQILK